MKMNVEIVDSPYRAVEFSFAPSSLEELHPRAGKADFSLLQDKSVLVEIKDGANVSTIEDVHPDLLVLSALLIMGQTRTETLELPFTPSALIQERVKSLFKLELLGPAECSPSPARIAGGVPGLAFSGGIDSCAALVLLPTDTVSVFMLRDTGAVARAGLYRPEAAIASVEAVANTGRHCVSLRSNVETIRTPIGFPVDWSNALPLVVNADSLRLGSISFGTVLESAVSLGKYEYSELTARTIYSRWAPIFEAAGVQMSLPVAGLSEVSTSSIVRRAATFTKPQSCVRGVPGVPCGRCFKYFRKRLTDWALGGTPMTDEEIRTNATSREVTTRLLQTPIHHEIGIAWAVSRITSDNPIVEALRKRAKAIIEHTSDLGYLERHYAANFETMVPLALQSSVRTEISKLLPDMEMSDVGSVRSWNIRDLPVDPLYIEGVEATSKALEQLSLEANS